MDERERFPGVLWILPIFFGFIGGTIGALIAGCCYRDTWWELFLIGIIIQVMALVGASLILIQTGIDIFGL